MNPMKAYVASHPAIEHRPAPAQVGDLFYHNYGYDPITSFEKWEWSFTFGCWAGLVTFADGWRGYTYPDKRASVAL